MLGLAGVMLMGELKLGFKMYAFSIENNQKNVRFLRCVYGNFILWRLNQCGRNSIK